MVSLRLRIGLSCPLPCRSACRHFLSKSWPITSPTIGGDGVLGEAEAVEETMNAREQPAESKPNPCSAMNLEFVFLTYPLLSLSTGLPPTQSDAERAEVIASLHPQLVRRRSACRAPPEASNAPPDSPVLAALAPSAAPIKRAKPRQGRQNCCSLLAMRLSRRKRSTLGPSRPSSCFKREHQATWRSKNSPVAWSLYGKRKRPIQKREAWLKTRFVRPLARISDHTVGTHPKALY